MSRDVAESSGFAVAEAVAATEAKGVSTADVAVEYLDLNLETLLR